MLSISKASLHALRLAPHTLHPFPYALRPAPCAIRPAPHASRPKPYALRPATYALRLTPCALRHVFSGLRLFLALALFASVVLWHIDTFALEKKFQWSARLGFSEQYTSNVDLAPDNEESDWITRIGPGLTLAVLFEETEVRLDYDMRYAFYANNSDRNAAEHYLTLSGLQDIPISERMTLDLDLAVSRRTDPLSLNEQIASTRRSTEPYWRYRAGGRVNYYFGEEDLVYVGFDYTELNNDDPTVQDSRGYGPRGGVAYWFNIRNGISANLSYRKAEFDVSSDYDQLRGSGTYTYRFNPRTQANLTYSYFSVEYDEEGVRETTDIADDTLVFDRDFKSHTFTVGASHEFTPNISGDISAGFSIRKPKEGDKSSEPTASGSLTMSFDRSSFTLQAEGGPGFQTLEASNLGYNVYARASAVYTYQLLENLSTSLGASYWYKNYKDTASVSDITAGLGLETRKDHTWGGNAALSYLFLRWLSGSLTYQYRQRESNFDQNDFIDNRVTLRLTAFHLSEPKPF